MKKKSILVIAIIVLLVILLFPIPMKLKDGGSIEFKALLYSVTKYHQLAPENSEKEYIDGIGIKILGKEIYNSVDKNVVNNPHYYSAGNLVTALTLEDKIENDTIWCGTFQLIWNDLKNDLAKQDIVFTPQLEVVENLNKETFTVNDLSEKYYYKKVGTPSLQLKEEIEKAIKEKFNEISDILDDFEWENRDPKDYFLYAMLKKNFEFEKVFEEFENGKFGNYENVKYFGIKKNSESDELRKQVEVLYYNSKDDFAIKLKTKQEDEVILCKNPKGNTFNEIYQNIEGQKNTYKGNKRLQEGELLKVPNIKLNEKTEFREIQNKSFLFSNGDSYRIEKALQTIQFELDKTGGKIKSEAGMMVKYESAMMIDEIREFAIDDTFAIFLVEQGKETPYFAGKISDISKVQDGVKKPEQKEPNFSKVIDNTKLELSIPSEWKYEEMQKNKENDFYKYALKVYKSSEEQYAMLYFYNNQFAVCGTERTSKNITLNNGKEATIGYYYGNEDWLDISFYNMNKSIAILNHGLINEEANEAIEFIKTINITENKDNDINNKVTTIDIQTNGLSSAIPMKKYTLNQEEIYTIFNIIDNLTFSEENCDGLPTYFINYNSEEKENFVTYGIETFENEYHVTSSSGSEAILSSEQKEKLDEIIKKLYNE